MADGGLRCVVEVLCFRIGFGQIESFMMCCTVVCRVAKAVGAEA